MKNLLYFFFALLLISCTKENDPEPQKEGGLSGEYVLHIPKGYKGYYGHVYSLNVEFRLNFKQSGDKISTSMVEVWYDNAPDKDDEVLVKFPDSGLTDSSLSVQTQHAHGKDIFDYDLMVEQRDGKLYAELERSGVNVSDNDIFKGTLTKK